MSAPDPICGVWELDQWIEFRDGDPYVLDAGGRLFYDAEGQMSAILTRETEGETSVLAYSGHWHRTGDEIRHTVEFATLPQWVGTTLVRTIVEFTPGGDGRLLLRTPPKRNRDGAEFLHDLVWTRAV